MDRRHFLKNATALTVSSLVYSGCSTLTKSEDKENAARRPNIILVMADDLGWGDVGYNGNETTLTPELDNMAGQAVRLDRFYAAAPVCSPTRGSCLTGRHPYRYNIPWAGENPLPAEEITIAEALKTAGYSTGHFGKWHVGTLSKTVKQSEFPGAVEPANYSPPWENGFDECFSTESMVPTYNPYYHVGGDYGTDDYRMVQDVPVEKGQRTGGHRWRSSYWTGPGQMVDEWLEGDDSKIIMDRALSFIKRKSNSDQPFLSVIWFHAPHTPVVAGHDDRRPFDDLPAGAQHWFGCVHAMDRQIGRLRKELKHMGISDNTLVWFCSDNGPSYIHDWNSAGPLKGKKATLWEGGIRVPAVIEWPAKFKKPRTVRVPVCTSDYYPTLLKIAGIRQKDQPVLDGIDVIPVLTGAQKERAVPIAFQSPLKGDRWEMQQGKESMVLIDNQFKLASFDGGKSFQLYDLLNDVAETNDISAEHPQRVEIMKKTLMKWQRSCQDSAAGKDYR